MEKAYRSDVQLMRALAVSSVVVFHANENWLPGGFLGVDVFFVISGFVIGRTIIADREAGAFTFSAFYKRRIARLFPALFATVAVTLVVAWAIWPLERMPDLVASALASLLSVANIYFWLQSGYFDASAIEKPFLHMWSLGVEEQFYLIFPFVIVALTTRNRLLFICVVSALIALSAGVSQVLLGRYPDAAFYLSPLRAFGFLYGTLVVVLPPPGWSITVQRAVYGCCLIALLAMLMLWSAETPLPGWRGLLAATCAAAMIWLGRSVTFTIPPLKWIGDASYAIYLAHWPVVVFLAFSLAAYDPVTTGLIAIGLGLLVGALLHYTVEKPFRQRDVWIAVKGPIASSSMVVAIVALVTFGQN